MNQAAKDLIARAAQRAAFEANRQTEQIAREHSRRIVQQGGVEPPDPDALLRAAWDGQPREWRTWDGAYEYFAAVFLRRLAL